VKCPWSPKFSTRLLSSEVIGNVRQDEKSGAALFYRKAGIYSLSVSGYGGHRGPDLTYSGEIFSVEQITIKILSGGGNMPAFGPSLSGKELSDQPGELS
jgi:ubiquinol-cytochrome c reductase cytochrome b subunit